MASLGGLGTGLRDSTGENKMTDATWQRAKCDSGNCAEVKVEGDRVYLRSSLNHQLVTFTAAEWNTFRQAIKDGEFDQ